MIDLETAHVPSWQADRKIAFQSVGGPIPMQGSYALAPGGDGEPGGFFKLAEAVLMRMLQQQWRTNLTNLKDVLEAQG
jgi:hypothetical protein